MERNAGRTPSAEFVAIQGPAEGAPFPRAQLDGLLDLAEKGCLALDRLQREALGLEAGRRA